MVNDQIVDVPSVILVQDVHAYPYLIQVIKEMVSIPVMLRVCSRHLEELYFLEAD